MNKVARILNIYPDVPSLGNSCSCVLALDGCGARRGDLPRARMVSSTKRKLSYNLHAPRSIFRNTTFFGVQNGANLLYSWRYYLVNSPRP